MPVSQASEAAHPAASISHERISRVLGCGPRIVEAWERKQVRPH